MQIIVKSGWIKLYIGQKAFAHRIRGSEISKGKEVGENCGSELATIQGSYEFIVGIKTAERCKRERLKGGVGLYELGLKEKFEDGELG